MKLALCPRLLMCSRPFRPLGFAHLCRSRPRGSVHLLLPWRLYVDHSHCPRACASYPSCVAVYPRDSRSRRVLCRSSHSLHSDDVMAMSWLLVERIVQVSDHDIGMPRNVKEIREDLDRLPIFHLRLWSVCLNLLLRCFNVCVREITHHRVRTLARLS